MNIDLSYIEILYIRTAVKNEFDQIVELMKAYAERGSDVPANLHRKYDTIEYILEKIEQIMLSQ